MEPNLSNDSIANIELARVEMQNTCKAAMDDLVKANELCEKICRQAKAKYKTVVARENDLAMRPTS